MILLSSRNGDIGMGAGWEVLRSGGSALDAVEAATRVVESNADDDSVGLGGLPNILGEVQVDASIMDGRTLRTGAVAAVRGCEHAITLARHVMENLPHVLLAGEGAERFAREMGLPPRNLLTEERRTQWQRLLEETLGEEKAHPVADLTDLRLAVWKAMGAKPPGGTVNFIAQDKDGNIACAVSTSGWPWKYPGRVGDSPIIGAGNYADNRYGAAACTGMGELAVRTCAAHTAVGLMKAGHSPQAAGRAVLEEVLSLPNRIGGHLDILLLSADGTPSALTTDPEGCRYWAWADGMAKPEAKAYELVHP